MFGDGTIRFWKQHGQMAPRTTSNWDLELATSAGLVNGLFVLLEKVDYSKLPHPVKPQAECSPSLYWDCPTCKPITINHNRVAGLKPEMNAVFNWFTTKLKDKFEGPLPPEYCFGS